MRKKRKKTFVYIGISFISILILFFVVRFLSSPKLSNNVCANSVSCIKDLSGQYENIHTGTFMSKAVPIPPLQTEKQKTPSTLGEGTGLNKHIYVDLTHQSLYAVEGSKVVYSFPVSTGKWYYTPTGDFQIWIKLRYTRMTGGNPAIGTFYDLPNVPYTMFFYNREYPQTKGFGLHGAYWHNNFGHPMSHGCVNMKIEDAGKIFSWVDPPTTGYSTPASDKNQGTKITIYGQTPVE